MDYSKKCFIKENPLDEIINGLYLGDEDASCDKNILSNNKINHIIRVMQESDSSTNIFPDIKYIRIPIRDKEVCNLDLCSSFDKIGSYIKNKLDSKENILVHCKRGHHRSAIFVVAFLFKFMGWPLNIAFDHIKKLRPCALRRDTCLMKSLKKYINLQNNNINNESYNNDSYNDFYNKIYKINKPYRYVLVKSQQTLEDYATNN